MQITVLFYSFFVMVEGKRPQAIPCAGVTVIGQRLATQELGVILAGQMKTDEWKNKQINVLASLYLQLLYLTVR